MDNDTEQKVRSKVLNIVTFGTCIAGFVLGAWLGWFGIFLSLLFGLAIGTFISLVPISDSCKFIEDKEPLIPEITFSGFGYKTSIGAIYLTQPNQPQEGGRRGFYIEAVRDDKRQEKRMYISREAMFRLMEIYLYSFNEEDRKFETVEND